MVTTNDLYEAVSFWYLATPGSAALHLGFLTITPLRGSVGDTALFAEFAPQFEAFKRSVREWLGCSCGCKNATATKK